VHRPEVTAQYAEITSGLGIPEADGLIGAGRCDDTAIGGERDSQDFVRMSCQQSGRLFKRKGVNSTKKESSAQ
jgi:hypothetical protein